jgi:hypothetical protein
MVSAEPRFIFKVNAASPCKLTMKNSTPIQSSGSITDQFAYTPSGTTNGLVLLENIGVSGEAQQGSIAQIAGSTITSASGVMDVTMTRNRKNLMISLSAGNTDLTTINSQHFDGEEITFFFYASNDYSRTFTINNRVSGLQNIILPYPSTSIVLKQFDSVTLRRMALPSPYNNRWIVTSVNTYRSNGQVLGYDEKTASYTLALTDMLNIQKLNHATVAIAVTVPANSSVAFPIGTEFVVHQYGAAACSFVAGGGVTIRSIDSGLRISNQYGMATLRKIGTDEWLLVGNIVV